MSSTPRRPRRAPGTPSDPPSRSGPPAAPHGSEPRRFVLSTRTAAEAAEGALLERLLELLTSDDRPARALDVALPTPARPDGVDAPRGDQPDIDRAVPGADVGSSASAARSRLERAARAYARALMHEGVARHAVLEAIDALIRSGASELPADALEELSLTARRSAFIALVIR